MHFYDEAHISVRAGKGGDGIVAWRREKFVPRGGPAGGDGGDGAHIVLRANQNLATLAQFVTKKHFQAPDGVKGGQLLRAGARGEDLVLEVPVGTIIRRRGESAILADLSAPGQEIVLARGGRGGYGNARFTTAVRQSPSFAELGEPGEALDVDLELKLVADVGIIGIPSAGKSTLISVISNVRPKIADYPFTTLVPNLGVVEHRGTGFVASDVPGLIEGAHAGKGLGDAFLRHVERTAVLVHLLDLTRPDPVADYVMINRELALYSETLAAKRQIVVVNKIDILDEDSRAEMIADIQARLPKEAGTVFAISAAARLQIDALLDEMRTVVLAARAERAATEAAIAAQPALYQPAAHPDRRVVKFSEEGGGFRVSSPRMEQLAVMTDPSNDEALARLYDVLKKRGILQRLVKRGLVEGMPIFVGAHRLEYFGEDAYGG